MTNVRPSSTFMSVPRYTTAYVNRETSNFEINLREPTKDPDPLESEINYFDCDKTNREKALKEKNIITKDLKGMYNNTLQFKSNNKIFLTQPKERRKEVSYRTKF